MAQAIGSAPLRAGLAWVFAIGSLCLGSACIGGPHPLPPDNVVGRPHDGASGAGVVFGNAGTSAGMPTTAPTASTTTAGAAGAGGSKSPQAGSAAGDAADAGEECGDAGAHRALGDICPRDDDGGALGR